MDAPRCVCVKNGGGVGGVFFFFFYFFFFFFFFFFSPPQRGREGGRERERDRERERETPPPPPPPAGGDRPGRQPSLNDVASGRHRMTLRCARNVRAANGSNIYISVHVSHPRGQECPFTSVGAAHADRGA